MSRVCIVGAGYVGLCTGAVFAELGHDVVLVDTDERKLEAIRAGRAPFHEPGLDDALRAGAARLRAAPSVRDGVPGADLVFLCVGTPSRPDGSLDASFVQAAAADVGAAVRTGRDPILVVKSTVLPGTVDGVVAAAAAAGRPLRVVSNPEFLREGSALSDARRPNRIVVGSDDGAAAEAVLALYDGLPGERIRVAARTAECIKYAANAFLAARVALANEIANYCERAGVDWLEVATGIGKDPRIGPLFLQAGAGFGGSCFPKDVAALASAARAAGDRTPMLDAVLRNNAEQPSVVVRLLREELGALQGKRVALLGLAFKPATDDVRETRALPIWQELVATGAEVWCHDPKAGAAFQRIAPGSRIAATPEDALRGADAAVVQTDWAEYGRIPVSDWPPVVVDGRRALAPAPMLAAGRRYRAIGYGRRRDADGR